MKIKKLFHFLAVQVVVAPTVDHLMTSFRGAMVGCVVTAAVSGVKATVISENLAIPEYCRKTLTRYVKYSTYAWRY